MPARAAPPLLAGLLAAALLAPPPGAFAFQRNNGLVAELAFAGYYNEEVARRTFYTYPQLERRGLEVLRAPPPAPWRPPVPLALARAAGSDAAAPPCQILYLHGNAESLLTEADTLQAIARETGCDAYAVEYVGYGPRRWEGPPSERRLVADAAAALDFIRARHAGVPTVVWGTSLGTGVALGLAATAAGARVDGIILQSAFLSLLTSQTDGGRFDIPGLSWIVQRSLDDGDFFKNAEAAARLGRQPGGAAPPALVVHGQKDELVPLKHGLELFELYPGRKTFALLEGAGHNDVFRDHGAQLWPAVEAFVASVVPAGAPGGPSWLDQLLPMEGGQPGADARFEPGSTGGFLFPPPTLPAAEAFAGPTPSVDGAAGWGALVAGDDG